MTMKMKMEATEEEIQWALAIKLAAQRDLEIRHHSMSDLEFLHHALIAKDKVDAALRRIRRLQQFKERYGIKGDGSYEEGLREIETFYRIFPQLLVGFGRDPDGAAILCTDLSAYVTSRLNCEEAYAVAMRFFFYVLQATQSDVVSMRQGVRGIVDVSNLTWRNFSVEAEKRSAQLYARSYPVRVKKMTLMGAHVLVRLFYNLLRMTGLLPTKVARAFEFPAHQGIYLRSTGIDQANLPLGWGGTQTVESLQLCVTEKMKERYENAAMFQLPTVCAKSLSSLLNSSNVGETFPLPTVCASSSSFDSSTELHTTVADPVENDEDDDDDDDESSYYSGSDDHDDSTEVH